jgi:uncharacterized membrane protein
MYRGVSPLRWAWVLIGVLILGILVVGMASLLYSLYLGHPYYSYFPLFGFGWLIVIILLASFVFRLAFRPWRKWGGYRRYDPAFQTLRERYARGEITKDQFRNMVRDLRDDTLRS